MNTIPIIINKTMDEVKLMQVIYCTKKRSGNGIENDPIRRVTEIFDTDGNLLADKDPFKVYSRIDMIEFAKFIVKDHSKGITSIPELLDRWVINELR